MKFGGTSMAGTERIRRVANIVRKQAARGNEVAVVVSAMAGETDRLVNFCREANPLYDPAEYDVSTNQPLRIGFGQTEYFAGKMSDIRLYNRALNDQEIQKISSAKP